MMQLEIPHDCQIEGLAEIYHKWLIPNVDVNPSFIEIGAYDGLSWSNTYALSKAGWSGLYFEPVVEFARRCAENHAFNKKVRVVCCAIGEVEQLSKVAIAASITTLDPDHLKAYTQISWAKEALEQTFSGFREVPVFRLENVLKELSVSSTDLLVIDVEGYEESVLNSFSMVSLSPKMVICEIQDDHADFSGYQEITERNLRVRNFILSFGYTEVYRDHTNTVFVTNEIFKRT